MKLSELFQLPVYQNIRVLASHEGLLRQVKSINMMDTPDIMDYLKPDDYYSLCHPGPPRGADSSCSPYGD
ncbi:hypothetical protein ACVLD2_001930 [Paenibacillus sp. PvR052]